MLEEVRINVIRLVVFLVYTLGTALSFISGGAVGAYLGFAIRGQRDEAEISTAILGAGVTLLIVIAYLIIGRCIVPPYTKAKNMGIYSGIAIIGVAFIYVSKTTNA